MKHQMPDLPQAHRFRHDADFPFCSERCRQRDLGNWATEKYKVSAPMMDESEPEETEAESSRAHREHVRSTTTNSAARASRASRLRSPPASASAICPKRPAPGARSRASCSTGYRAQPLQFARASRLGRARNATASLVVGFAWRRVRATSSWLQSWASGPRDRALRSICGKKDPQIRGDRRSCRPVNLPISGSGHCRAHSRSTGNICCWALYFFVSSIFGSHFPRGKPNLCPAAWASWRMIGSPAFTRRSVLWIARALGL